MFYLQMFTLIEKKEILKLLLQYVRCLFTTTAATALITVHYTVGHKKCGTLLLSISSLIIDQF